MRIIGGSFGTRGKIKVGDFGLHIKSSREAVYPPGTLTRVATRQEKERRFSGGTCFIGMLFLGFVGYFFLGFLGLIIGVVMAILGSFNSQVHYLVDIDFKDGEQLTLETTRRQADQLVQLK